MLSAELGEKIEYVLDQLETVGGDRLKSTHNTTAWHPDPLITSNPTPPPRSLLSEPNFIKGARSLAAHNLVLDVWAYHTQLEEVCALARSCPDTTIVIDPLGWPLHGKPNILKIKY